MSTFPELTAAAGKVIASSAILCNKLGFPEVEKNIAEQLRSFKNRQLTVVVAGEARKGKSSLLNALLDQQTPLFPVDINVCTNVVTIVRYGTTEQILAYIEDPNSKTGFRAEELTRQQIPDYVSESGNPNNYKRVKKLEARIPCEVLKDGIVFVDTPGVGSLNIEHAETTFSYLPYADVLLFVTSANAPMTETELNFLKRGYTYCDTIVYPLTMMDLNANYDTIAQDNTQKVAKALKVPRDEVRVIPVSSMAKQRFLRSHNKILYNSSNFEALQKAIWSAVATKRGAVLLLPYLSETEKELRKLADSLTSQLQVLGNDSAAEELEQSLGSQISRLQTLQEDGAQWKNDLAVFFPELQCEITLGKTELTTRVEEEIDRYMDEFGVNICEKENYTNLLGEINAIITQKVLDIQQYISETLGGKIQQLQQDMSYSLTLQESSLKKISFEADTDLDIQFPAKKNFNGLINKGRGIASTSMGCGAVGTVAGALVGGIVGFFSAGPLGVLAGAKYGAMVGASSGSMVGSAKGMLDSLKQHDSMDAALVRKSMSKYSVNSINRAYTIVGATLNQLRVETAASFELHLKKEIQEIQESIHMVKENLNVEKNLVPKKKAELKARAAALSKQLNTVIRLQEIIDGIQVVVPVMKAPGASGAQMVRQDNPVRKPDPPQPKSPVSKPENKDITGLYDFL